MKFIIWGMLIILLIVGGALFGGYFYFDDDEAAERYRLMQAQNLIRVCVNVIPQSNGKPVRVFVSMREDRHKGGGYRVMADVLSSKEGHPCMMETLSVIPPTGCPFLFKECEWRRERR